MRPPLPALAVLFTLAFAAPAMAQTDAAPHPGAKDFTKKCARCHTPQKVVRWMKKKPDTRTRRAWLDKKLSRHFARNKNTRRNIIAYLEALAAAR